ALECAALGHTGDWGARPLHHSVNGDLRRGRQFHGIRPSCRGPRSRIVVGRRSHRSSAFVSVDRAARPHLLVLGGRGHLAAFASGPPVTQKSYYLWCCIRTARPSTRQFAPSISTGGTSRGRNGGNFGPAGWRR